MKGKEKAEEMIKWMRLFLDAFSKRNVSAYAGQAAFFLMLSFFPFLMFFFEILKLTPLTEAKFESWAMTIIPESFQELISFFAKEIYAGGGGRLSLTIVTAVFLSAKAFVSLTNGLNSMHQVHETRNFILRKLYAMVCSVVFAFMLLLTLALMVFGRYLYDYLLSGIPVLKDIIHFRLLICVLVLFLFFLILYVALPNKKLRARTQLTGALFAAVGWNLFSYLFSVYVERFSKYATFYGTMTLVALVMVWLYGCMYVLFLGGFINCILEKRKNWPEFRLWKFRPKN